MGAKDSIKKLHSVMPACALDRLRDATSVPDGECWEWSGRVRGGSPYHGGLNLRRIYFPKPVGRGTAVVTTCGNDRCFNPDHAKAVRTMRPRLEQPHRKDGGPGAFMSMSEPWVRAAAVAAVGAGLSQGEAAKFFGVSQPTISRWVRDAP